MGLDNDTFHFEETSRLLVLEDIPLKHFYYNRNNKDYPFCYYHDHLLLDITAFTVEAIITRQTVHEIRLSERRLNNALEEKKYRDFFALIDPRLALYTYQNIYSRLDDLQKYQLFWYIVRRCNMELSFFPEDFLIFLSVLYKNSPAPPDSFYDIYCGFRADKAIFFKHNFRWSRNINTAIYYACENGKPGTVFQGTARNGDVLYFDPDKRKNEVYIPPSKIKNLKKINLPDCQDILSTLDRQKVWILYNYYLSLLRRSYFHRPDGIHGVSHTKRVLFLCLLIAMQIEVEEQELSLLCLCSIYHDIGRENDNWDINHGINSMIKGNGLDLFSSIADDELQIIRYIIENHCIDDKLLFQKTREYNLKDPERALELLSIFKDADGLDRIRIFDLDVTRLRHEQANRLLLTTRQLYYNPIFDNTL